MSTPAEAKRQALAKAGWRRDDRQHGLKVYERWQAPGRPHDMVGGQWTPEGVSLRTAYNTLHPSGKPIHVAIVVHWFDKTPEVLCGKKLTLNPKPTEPRLRQTHSVDLTAEQIISVGGNCRLCGPGRARGPLPGFEHHVIGDGQG